MYGSGVRSWSHQLTYSHENWHTCSSWRMISLVFFFEKICYFDNFNITLFLVHLGTYFWCLYGYKWSNDADLKSSRWTGLPDLNVMVARLAFFKSPCLMFYLFLVVATYSMAEYRMNEFWKFQLKLKSKCMWLYLCSHSKCLKLKKYSVYIDSPLPIQILHSN